MAKHKTLKMEGGPLSFHPLANRFPLIEGAEFDALVENIKVHGLKEPITIYQEKILDGRNRELACIKAGVKGHYTPFQGTDADAAAFVFSKNFHRRHLNAEQRTKILIQIIAKTPEKSDRQFGKELGVDHKTIARARSLGWAWGTLPTTAQEPTPAKKPKRGTAREAAPKKDDGAARSAAARKAAKTRREKAQAEEDARLAANEAKEAKIIKAITPIFRKLSETDLKILLDNLEELNMTMGYHKLSVVIDCLNELTPDAANKAA